MKKDVYLGDGLYASHDWYQFYLIAERGIGSTHYVALEPEVLQAFLKYVERVAKVKITVEKIDPFEPESEGDK